MERPAKKRRLTEDRDQDKVPTESKQQHIQISGSASTGKPNMDCKSESLAGSQAQSDENHGLSTSKTEPSVNDGSSTPKTKAYDNHGYSGSEVSSGDNDNASGSESESLESAGNSSGSVVSSGDHGGSSGSENESSEPSGFDFKKEERRWRAKQEAILRAKEEAIWRAVVHDFKDDSWLAALPRSERRVFLGLLGAGFRFPWSIMQIITKMGGGYVVVCEICEEEVHDSQSEPELPCWCETESLPFCPPLPLCDSCYDRKYSEERNEPASYYGFGPWLQCSKCKYTFFNWGV